jgi:hypothetical protein
LLVVLLLAVTACAASHSLHEFFHTDCSTDGHFCLVCCFAKGQVSPAPAAIVLAVFVFYCLGSLRLASAPAFAGPDYRLCPSRAPPAAAFPKTAVG